MNSAQIVPRHIDIDGGASLRSKAILGDLEIVQARGQFLELKTPFWVGGRLVGLLGLLVQHGDCRACQRPPRLSLHRPFNNAHSLGG